MRTVNDLIKDLQELVKQDAKVGFLPIIYSSDDEGNYYHKVDYSPSLAQVENINEWSLEMVGSFDGPDGVIDLKDINCVIIN